MSGKHQRRMWTLPAPTGGVSRYDRMQLVVGRAISGKVLVDHDTLSKTLSNYLLEQDTFVKALTSIETLTDTLISVSVSFNYEVNQDTLIRILTDLNVRHDTSIRVTAPQPVPPASSGGGESSGRINKAPIGVHKKKKQADEIIKLDKLNVSKMLSKKLIQIRVEALFEIKLIIGEAKLITENNIQSSTILNVDLADTTDTRPIEVEILGINREEN
jgi:hypothetical protein